METTTVYVYVRSCLFALLVLIIIINRTVISDAPINLYTSLFKTPHLCRIRYKKITFFLFVYYYYSYLFTPIINHRVCLRFESIPDEHRVNVRGMLVVEKHEGEFSRRNLFSLNIHIRQIDKKKKNVTGREYVFESYVHAVAANDYVVNFLLIFFSPR